jgi:hypothetical protein
MLQFSKTLYGTKNCLSVFPSKLLGGVFGAVRSNQSSNAKKKHINFKIRNEETKKAAFETTSSATVQAPRRFLILAKPSFQSEDADFYESFLFPWEIH